MPISKVTHESMFYSFYGGHLGRHLGFEGHHSKFSRAHQQNMFSNELSKQKNKVCLVCTDLRMEPKN